MPDEVIAQMVDQKKQRMERILATAATRDRSEVAQYERDWEAYLIEYERFLKDQRTRTYGHIHTFAFLLQISSAVAATDVTVTVSFPADSFVVGISDRDDVIFGDVLEPPEPDPPWSYSSVISGALAADKVSPRPYRRGPRYDYDDRSVVFYEDPKLRPSDDWYMEPVIAYIPPTIMQGFRIRYAIRADKLLKPVDDVLSVTLE